MRSLLLAAVLAAPAAAQSTLAAEIDRRAREIEPQVLGWRRDFHEHPELSNREQRTGRIVADYLKSRGMEVAYPVANTGVVAVLKGGRPGPVVALRADMDALPVTEEVELPFASKARAVWNGEEVGVMHACGHDCHVAILLRSEEHTSELQSRGLISYAV